MPTTAPGKKEMFTWSGLCRRRVLSTGARRGQAFRARAYACAQLGGEAAARASAHARAWAASSTATSAWLTAQAA